MSISSLLEIIFAVFQVLAFIWPVWLLLFATVTIRFVSKYYTDRRFRRAGMNDLDRLTGEDFEEYLALLFERLGYLVERTPSQGDFGADLILEQDGERTAVQAKRYSEKVNISAVQQVVAAKGFYQCSRAIVVTNNYFTQQAMKLAKANNVLLWDRRKLTNILIGSTPTAIETVRTGPEPEIQPIGEIHEDVCEKCSDSVSSGVRKYCLDKPQVYGGKVYCMKCQPVIRGRKLVVTT